MAAAIYARKSTEQNGVADDATKRACFMFPHSHFVTRGLSQRHGHATHMHPTGTPTTFHRAPFFSRSVSE